MADVHPCTHARQFLCLMSQADVRIGSSDTSPTILIPVLVFRLTWNVRNITMAYCNFGSKAFRVKPASWDTTMLYFQPILWCSLSFASLCSQPFGKFLSSAQVFASGGELFIAALSPAATQDFIVSCMAVCGNRRRRYTLLEVLSQPGGGGGRFRGERQHGEFYITHPPFSFTKFLGKSRVFT